MGTKISYQTYDGGDGSGCPTVLIGYCRETPFEVLKSVLFTHDVYTYLGLYRPIDYSYPNNVSGLVISEFNDGNGITITGELYELDLSRAKAKNNRSREQVLKDLELCRKWHTYSHNLKFQQECWERIDEIKDFVANVVIDF